MTVFSSAWRKARARLDTASTVSVGARGIFIIHSFLLIVFLPMLFNRSEQGYFFTFLSLATAYTLIELSLSSTLVYFTGHEWAKLGEEASDRVLGRLNAIARVGLAWYGAILFVVFAAMVGGGMWFFRGTDPSIVWRGPWLLLSVGVTLEVVFLPFWSLMEGSRHVNYVYGFRMSRALAMAAGTWVTLILGGKLWAIGVGYISTFPVALGFVLCRSRRAREIFWSVRAPKGETTDMVRSIWSMQSRTGVNAILGYLSTWAVTPISLKLFGPVSSGQIGMTFSIVMAVTSLANSYVVAKYSLLSVLSSRRDYPALDKELVHIMSVSAAIVVAAIIGLPIGLSVLASFGYHLGDRMLPTMLTEAVLAGALLNQMCFCAATYIRAHRIEPMVPVSIGNSILFVGSLFALGPIVGARIAPLAYLSTVALFVVPMTFWIFIRHRSEWIRDAARAEP